MITLLKERGEQNKTKNSSSFYHPSNPPLFLLLLQLPFLLNGFLSEMQMFSRVTLLWNIVEWSPPFIHSGDTHTGPRVCGIQLRFESTENYGNPVCLIQSKALLMSVTHGAGGLQRAQKWVFKPRLHSFLSWRSCYKAWVTGDLGIVWFKYWNKTYYQLIESEIIGASTGLKWQSFKSRAHCFPHKPFLSMTWTSAELIVFPIDVSSATETNMLLEVLECRLRG